MNTLQTKAIALQASLEHLRVDELENPQFQILEIEFLLKIYGHKQYTLCAKTLIEELKTNKSTIGRIIHYFSARGIITTQLDLFDKRKKYIALTVSGFRIIEKILLAE